jgi:hypothetical protein
MAGLVFQGSLVESLKQKEMRHVTPIFSDLLRQLFLAESQTQV